MLDEGGVITTTGLGAPTIDQAQHAADHGLALARWLERLTEGIGSGNGPLASATEVASALLEAVDAGRVDIYAASKGESTLLVSVPGDASAEHRPTVTSSVPRELPLDVVLPEVEEERGGGRPSDAGAAAGPTDRLVLPLVHHDGAHGLLVLSWAEPRSLDTGLRSIVDSAAAVLGLSLSRHQLLEAGQRRAQLHRAVIEGARMLVSQPDDDHVLDKLVDIYADLVGATLCAIALVDAKTTTITTVATRGTEPLEGPIPLSAIPRKLLEPVERKWRSEPVPIDVGDDPWLRAVVGGGTAGATWYRLVPLLLGHDACGAVILGFSAERRLDPEETLAIGALTDISSAALEQAFHIKRRVRELRHLDALHQLTSALADGDDAPSLIARINDVLSVQGVEVTTLAFADRTVARQLRADTLATRERTAEFRRDPWAETPDGIVSIPMTSGRRLVGAMRARVSDVDTDTRALVEALADGLAAAVSREQVRSAVAETEQQRRLSAEQQRIAHDLHDGVGQLFVAIRLLAEDHVDAIPAGSPTRERVVRMGRLASQGKQEIDHAIRGLSLAPSGSEGIVAALKKLAREVARDSGLDVKVHVHGKRARLASEVERALFRVAHEALANAWRHAHCGRVDVELWFDRDATVLRVVDDGTGFTGSPSTDGVGTAGMRRAVEDMGGHLDIREADPRGTRVEAYVPGGCP